ncbi:hypothetical protein SVIO_040130 [Streptomyces violaceusniger]|uniref:Uncharacterized protein n=2 Tax=Streptomyces violaceusniger TaxID=68280 RepID=A0A4D4L369_STRVO|nr:hypothetical protein SVIO_040130 [Streptomyces violaceusniger]
MPEQVNDPVPQPMTFGHVPPGSIGPGPPPYAVYAARLALRDAITTDADYELTTGIHLGISDGEDP